VALLQTQQFIVAALDGQIVGAPWQDGNTVSTSSAAATLMLD
jgi:hypothetical protein